jgi:hypothetical protein
VGVANKRSSENSSCPECLMLFMQDMHCKVASARSTLLGRHFAAMSRRHAPAVCDEHHTGRTSTGPSNSYISGEDHQFDVSPTTTIRC